MNCTAPSNSIAATSSAMDSKTKIEIWARGWNVLRYYNRVALIQAGNELITSMCNECVENRTAACEQCSTWHTELDALETQIVPDLFPFADKQDDDVTDLPSQFRFDRTVAARDILNANIQNHCSCGQRI
jgi:hypothetical protein